MNVFSILNIAFSSIPKFFTKSKSSHTRLISLCTDDSSFLFNLVKFFPNMKRFPLLAFSWSPKILNNLLFPEPRLPVIETRLHEGIKIFIFPIKTVFSSLLIYIFSNKDDIDLVLKEDEIIKKIDYIIE